MANVAARSARLRAKAVSISRFWWPNRAPEVTQHRSVIRITMRKIRFVCVMTLILTVTFAIPIAAQVQTEVPPVVPGAKPVKVERSKIHGTALEGNLEGDAVDRDVLVFLPPSYDKQKSRRYPVVYALHGYSIGAEQWSKEIHVPQTIDNPFFM